MRATAGIGTGEPLLRPSNPRDTCNGHLSYPQPGAVCENIP
jgi:hypothetical protein